MNIENCNFPAMPIYLTEAIIGAAESGADEIVNRVSGLTKREYFAAMAMQGILSDGIDFTLYDDKDVAAAAVLHADWLLAELERTK